MRIPNRNDSLELLQSHQCDNPQRVAHSLAVAQLAMAIGQNLNARGLALDLELIEAAAILHDIRKGHPDHDRSGAELLRALDYHSTAAVVEVHTRLGGRTPAPDEPITEAEVVYIADKSYRRTNRVSIEDRYSIWKNTWKDNPERLESLTRGENRAKAVRERIEKALGQPLQDV
ncbi:Deoxyguanosinetriphosphate triphosphohydrolase-like protein [Fundidesulfovibrio magnetotacticus]|uniref:Deoxyguanosinetriphosphate triphosphohydrolase-like protein n=1 Tax=Fundidesulfovibrio magnetotacticus TaxID=2730080 RepID=A0A6V8LX56_9BACT|nr:HD domain-containing protein [Fundidesulfovibrio magnetotacticus]GFK94227.1 Deoxyguanosinetriphosphate triphosphohydrolase-like protein [Fundidesulfovibrio magnetotacticus]